MNHKRKTHCVRGHEFTAENTRVLKSGTRICRACKREWAREHTGLRGRPKDNRNQNTDVTHCKRGHEFTEENTYVKGKHRVCRECHRASCLERDRADRKDPVRRANKRQRRRKCQLKKMGWTVERFESKVKENHGCCEICGIELEFNLVKNGATNRAHADHKHVVPPIPRGILCGNCNLGIGNLKENPEILNKAIEYLRRYENEQHDVHKDVG